MLGSRFVQAFEADWSAGTGWQTEGVGAPFQAAVPNLVAGTQETGRVDNVAAYLTTQGGPDELRNLARMTYRFGISIGFPRGQFESGAARLFSSPAAPSISLPSVPDLAALNAGEMNLSNYLKIAWDSLEDTGAGQAWKSFAQVSGSKIQQLTGNLPVVAVVASIVRIWARAIRGRISSIGEPDFSSAPSVEAWQARSGASSWSQESDQADADVVYEAIERGLDLTGLISPRTSEAVTTTVAYADGTGAFYAGLGDPDGFGGQAETIDLRRTGYAPGTDSVIRGWQNPVWAGEWVATGQFAVTARSLCSQAWQLAAAGHPSLGCYNLTLAKNRWRSYFRYLAWQILRGGRWIENPLPRIVGGFGDWTEHVGTLRKLWDGIASTAGWPTLNETIARTRPGLNMPQTPVIADEIVGEWAYRAAQSIDRSSTSDIGVQGLVETQNTPFRTLESAQDRQRSLFRGENPTLLPYAPTDAQGIPVWPGVKMSAVVRRQKITDVLYGPSVCDIDPDNIPDGPDANELRDAIQTRQSECSLGLAAAPTRATPLVVGGLGAADLGRASGLPGWLLLALGAGGVALLRSRQRPG